MTTTQIQSALRGLGMYWGRIDGISGPKTKEAVRRFQTVHPPLVVDGIAGRNTLAALFPVAPVDRDTDTHLVLKTSDYPRQKDVPEFYGRMGANQTKIDLPYTFRIAWDLNKTINKLTCHKKIAAPMLAIFTETLAHYGLDEVKRMGLDLYSGCLNVRKMRGGSNYSMHSWGVAIDMDPSHNQFKWNHTKARFAHPEYEPFWKIVEKHGAISLGRVRDFDWMHFQFARL